MAAKESDRRRGEHRATFVVGALLGGAAGAVWTLFNAPRSGAETRAALTEAVGTAVHGVQDAVAGVRERIRETGERAADRVALAVDAVAGGNDGGGESEPDIAQSTATASSPSMVVGAGPAADTAALTTPDATTDAATFDEPPSLATATDPPDGEAPGGPASGATTVAI